MACYHRCFPETVAFYLCQGSFFCFCARVHVFFLDWLVRWFFSRIKQKLLCHSEHFILIIMFLQLLDAIIVRENKIGSTSQPYSKFIRCACTLWCVCTMIYLSAEVADGSKQWLATLGLSWITVWVILQTLFSRRYWTDKMKQHGHTRTKNPLSTVMLWTLSWQKEYFSNNNFNQITTVDGYADFLSKFWLQFI